MREGATLSSSCLHRQPAICMQASALDGYCSWWRLRARDQLRGWRIHALCGHGEKFQGPGLWFAQHSRSP